MLWSLDETALDLFARRPAKGFRTGLSFVDCAVDGTGFQPRHVVEISGSSATPKLLVLLHAIAAFLLQSLDSDSNSDRTSAPRSAHDVATALARATERVFLFDHESEADAHELLAIVSDRLEMHISDPVQRRALARAAMDRVVVYNCRDTFQCLATLHQLHFELLDAPTTPLLLAFHCISSFHAIDKMTAKSVGDGLALSEQLFALLKQFSRHHSPVIFAAKETPALARSGWETPEFLPSSWSSQVSKRILLRPGAARSTSHSRDAGVKDDDDAAAERRFDAKCVVRGESREFACRVRARAIDVLEQQSHAQALKRGR